MERVGKQDGQDGVPILTGAFDLRWSKVDVYKENIHSRGSGAFKSCMTMTSVGFWCGVVDGINHNILSYKCV